MKTNEQNGACQVAAAMADAFPGASAYAEYCRLRMRGLRKQALAHLEVFLTEAMHWDQATQRNFVGRLAHIVETVPAGDYGPCPSPLVQRLVLPTLRAWSEATTASDPLRWLGRFTNDLQPTKAAFARDPNDVRARLTFTEHLIWSAEFAIHHLPDHFIGSAEESLATLEEAQIHLDIIASLGKETDHLQREIAELKQVIEDWIASGRTGRDSFLTYRQAHGRPPFRGCATFYYNR